MLFGRRLAAAGAACLLIGTTATPVPADAQGCGDGDTSCAVQPATIGDPIYANDLQADNGQGWAVGDSDTGREAFGGGYTVTVKKPHTSLSIHPEFRGIRPDQLEDVSVSAEAQRTLYVGSLDGHGVFCRMLNGSKYLFLTRLNNVDKTLAYGIYRDAPDGSSRALIRGEVPMAGSTFDLRGDCVGGPMDGTPAVLTLYANGQLLDQATDDQDPLPSGWAGLELESADGNTTVIFHNFAVSPVTPQ